MHIRVNRLARIILSLRWNCGIPFCLFMMVPQIKGVVDW